MSFITPLIDTLLHEVLGRRMDPPPRRELTQPVKPALPDQAPLAIRSDSRLDARRPLLPVQEAEVRAAGQSRAAGTKTSGHASPDQPPPASSATLLSPTARLIAQLLARHPAPAAVLRSVLPLISPAPAGPSASASEISGQLRSTLSESGLFYESHLKQWYRGQHSLEALAREPQARFFSKPAGPAAGQPAQADRDVPRVAPAEGARVMSTDGMKAAATVPAQSPATAAKPAAATASAENLPPAAESEGARPEPAAPRAALESSESLQQLLRHQLELLASPTLRWEGEVWQGLFMALTIQGPSQPVDDRPSAEGGGEEEQPEWQSELVLDTASLGQLRLRLQLQGEALHIDLSAEDAAVLGKLEAGRDELLQGLARQGFAAPKISMRLSEPGGESSDG